MKSTYQHLFGPVPSRRLGRSLGVDLMPFKICSFDCIFCQLGRTTKKTIKREEYVPVDEVIRELDEWLKAGGVADYITLSGSGEPTLNSQFGKVIEFARNATTIPVALLTNGSLLSDPDVRTQAAKANVVKVSRSAWDSLSFEHVNRPHRDLAFKNTIEGIREFRKMFSGEIWVEIFIMEGVNSLPTDVARIAEFVNDIKPNRIQLNTAVRPPAEDFVKAVPQNLLMKLAGLFSPTAEVIAEFSSTQSASVHANEETILAMLTRRPCTSEQIASAFDMHQNEVAKYIGKLMRTGRIQVQNKAGHAHYQAQTCEKSATMKEKAK